jgi:hypothetical protein
MGAHHDQVGLGRFGLFKDGKGRIANPDIRLTEDVHLYEPVRDAFHAFPGLFNSLDFQ